MPACGRGCAPHWEDSVARLGRAGIVAIVQGLARALPTECEVDGVARFARPVAQGIVGALVGVPEASRARLGELAEAVVGVRTEARPDPAEAWGRLSGFLEEEGDPGWLGVELSPTDGDVPDLPAVLVVAGVTTTVTLNAALVHRLSEAAPFWGKLASEAVLRRRFVEETLRLEAPVRAVPRVVTGPARVAGCPFAPGESVVVDLHATNRDPELWPNAGALRLDRPPAAHLSFGYGIHYCLGSGLARLQGEVVVEALTRKFAGVESGSTPPTRIRSPVFTGFAELPLVFRGGSSGGRAGGVHPSEKEAGA